jgi:hypothetical protein
MVIVARPLEDDELAARQWIEELATALYQGDDAAYINFFGPHDGDRIEAAYARKLWPACGGLRPPTTQPTSSATTRTSRPPEGAFLSERGRTRHIP